MIPPTESNKAQINDPKEMEINQLSDKKFRTVFLRKFSELQENIDRQLNEIRKQCMNKVRKSIRKQQPSKTKNPRVGKHN